MLTLSQAGGRMAAQIWIKVEMIDGERDSGPNRAWSLDAALEMQEQVATNSTK